MLRVSARLRTCRCLRPRETGAFQPQARLHGLIVGNRRQQQDYVRALEATGLKPVIDRTFALTDIPEAFRMQGSGGHFGKICLEY